MPANTNPYYIEPANPLQALMTGVQGFDRSKKNMLEDQMQAGRQEAMQALQSGGDIRTPLAKLIGIGDTKGAEAIATYANNDATQKFHQQSLAQTDAHQKAQLAQQGTFQNAQINNMQMQRALQERQQTNTENQPVMVPFGSGVMNKKGEMIREASGEASLDPKTLQFMAQQYRGGDTSVMTNLGRGAQGAQNIVALRKEIQRQNEELGQGGADQAIRNAEFFGVKSAARTVGTKGANIDLAATEFNQVLPVVQKASEAVDRTRFPDLNKVIQAYQEKTGDPNIVAFGGAVNTLVNIYARAISPQGVGTVSDKEHAREILQKAWSQGQFDAAVGMMKQEIDAALNSPTKVREEQRKRFLEGQQPSKNLTGDGVTVTGVSVEPQKAQQPTMPKPGEVRDGYRYKGGNPSDPSSWVQTK